MPKTAKVEKTEPTPEQVDLVEDISPQIETETPDAAPSQEDIALRAYEIFLRRGDAPGSDIEDWLQAERELKEEI